METVSKGSLEIMTRSWTPGILILCLLLGCGSDSSKSKSTEKAKPQGKAQANSSQNHQASASIPKGYSKEATLARLKRNLGDKNARKRAHAIRGLQFFRHHESLSAIRAALADKDTGVQTAAVLALAGFKDQVSLGELRQLFIKSRKKPDLQRAILSAFEHIHDDKTASFLQSAMPRLNSRLALLAYRVLRKIQKPRRFEGEPSRDFLESFTVSGRMGAGSQTKIQIEGKFYGIGDSIHEYKIKAIDAQEDQVTLVKGGKEFQKSIDISTEDEVDRAIRQTQSENNELVYESLLKLASLQSPRPSAELLAFIEAEDTSDDLRLAAIRAAGLCGIESALEPLQEILGKEKKTDYLIVSAGALAQLGDENSIDLLLPLLKHSSPWVRNTAVYALGVFVSSQTIPQLVSALFDRYSFVRSNALHQLVQMAQLGSPGEIRKILKSSYFSYEPNLTSTVLMQYLRQFPDEEATETSNPFSQKSDGTKIKKSLVKRTAKKYKPKFKILNMGQFGKKRLATIIEQGEKRRVYEGDLVEGKKLIRIDTKEELLHVDIGNGGVALLEKCEDGGPAKIFEIQ